MLSRLLTLVVGDLFLVLISLMLLAFLALIVWMPIASRRKRIKQEKENKHLRKTNRPTEGQVYKFADRPDLEFSTTEINDGEGRVDGTITVYLPAGAKVIYFDFSNWAKIKVRYLVKEGDTETGHDRKYDAGPNPQGLESWYVRYNEEIVFRNR